ncbi:hypothetical protein ABID23_000657 [Bartonella silvatica]|uniref:Uncharacterized protein n=1 Tax=Bartonella silvatica TaxID=357760 RepID=A0ABV2HG99_9HYPH
MIQLALHELPLTAIRTGPYTFTREEPIEGIVWIIAYSE